jgi:hypothetical protein
MDQYSVPWEQPEIKFLIELFQAQIVSIKQLNIVR